MIYPTYAYNAYKLILSARNGVQLAAFADERVTEMILAYTELFRVRNGQVYANKKGLSQTTKMILKGL